MSIEQTLERIAVAVEKLVALQEGQAAPIAGPAISNTMAAPLQGPSGTGPGQLPTQVQQIPPQAPAAFAPPSGPPPVAMPQIQTPPSGPGPVAMPQSQTPPAVSPPPQQVSATDTLDQIREAANSFNRAHPERAGEVWSIITRCGGDTNGGLASIPAQNHAAALQQIQALEA